MKLVKLAFNGNVPNPFNLQTGKCVKFINLPPLRSYLCTSKIIFCSILRLFSQSSRLSPPFIICFHSLNAKKLMSMGWKSIEAHERELEQKPIRDEITGERQSWRRNGDNYWMFFQNRDGVVGVVGVSNYSTLSSCLWILRFYHLVIFCWEVEYLYG